MTIPPCPTARSALQAVVTAGLMSMAACQFSPESTSTSGDGPDTETPDASTPGGDAMASSDATQVHQVACGRNDGNTVYCDGVCCERPNGSKAQLLDEESDFSCDPVCNGGQLYLCDNADDCPGNEICCVIDNNSMGSMCLDDATCSSMTDKKGCIPGEPDGTANGCGGDYRPECRRRDEDPFPICNDPS